MNRVVKETIKKKKNLSDFVTFGVLTFKEEWEYLVNLYEEKEVSYNYISSCIIKYVCRKAYIPELIDLSSKDKYTPIKIKVFTGQFSYNNNLGAYYCRIITKNVSNLLKLYYEDRLSEDIYQKWESIKNSLVRDNGHPADLITQYGESHLYFMRDPYTGYIKIGVSQHPNKRKYQIERQLGYKIELIKIIESGGFDMERELHYKFSKDRVHGEWFKPDAIIEYIA